MHYPMSKTKSNQTSLFFKTQHLRMSDWSRTPLLWMPKHACQPERNALKYKSREPLFPFGDASKTELMTVSCCVSTSWSLFQRSRTRIPILLPRRSRISILCDYCRSTNRMLARINLRECMYLRSAKPPLHTRFPIAAIFLIIRTGFAFFVDSAHHLGPYSLCQVFYDPTDRREDEDWRSESDGPRRGFNGWEDYHELYCDA